MNKELPRTEFNLHTLICTVDLPGHGTPDG